MRTWPPWNSSLGWSPRSLLDLLGGWVILSSERIRAWGSGVRKASDDVDVAEAQKERLRYGSFTAKVTSILSCFEIACLVNRLLQWQHCLDLRPMVKEVLTRRR